MRGHCTRSWGSEHHKNYKVKSEGYFQLFYAISINMCCYYPSLDVWELVHCAVNWLFCFVFHLIFISFVYKFFSPIFYFGILSHWSTPMMINPKACFSKHSQWPPKSFRLRQAWELVLLLSFLGCLRSLYYFFVDHFRLWLIDAVS